MKPSNFRTLPIGSISRNSETETIVQNIMEILSRTGDEFREISWEEYKSERLKDGKLSWEEEQYFYNGVEYCTSQEQAEKFCKNWGC